MGCGCGRGNGNAVRIRRSPGNGCPKCGAILRYINQMDKATKRIVRYTQCPKCGYKK